MRVEEIEAGKTYRGGIGVDRKVSEVYPNGYVTYSEPNGGYSGLETIGAFARWAQSVVKETEGK